MNIARWWSSINLKMRLMVFMTLTVSLIMSGLTFWSLKSIQEDFVITNTHFCRDIGILLASNILDFVEVNDYQKIAIFAEKVYLNTSTIRYILFFDAHGNLSLGLPLYSDKVQSLLQLEAQNFVLGVPLVKYNTIFQNYIIDIIIPLNKNGKHLGSIDLGVNLNRTFDSYTKLIRDVSIATLVSIWLMVMIGFVFNILSINKPIEQLLLGMKNIASGNFSYRIDLLVGGKLGNLIFSFNEMAKRLDLYEKKNVNQIMLEKIKLETIVSTITDAAMLVDTELRLLFVNQRALKSFGWSNLDIIGKFIYHFLPLQVNQALLPILNSLVRANCLYDFNYQTQEICINFNYHSPKTFRFLLTTVVESENNVLTGITIIVQDISQEIKLNEAKNQFITTISHELRTPLANIGSFLETLLDYHNSLNLKQKIHFLSIAHNETKRLSQLVSDILNLARLESENTYLMHPVNLMYIINNAVKASKLIANYNHVQLIVEHDINIKYVWAHENSLLQVFINLISNSIKFTSIKGKILLRVYPITLSYIRKYKKNVNKYPQMVRIEIIDEGIGINKRNQKHIFDRFVRVENHIHTLEGTGLGLSIVKKILTQHNTKIILQSSVLVGTSLCFDLIKAD
uniref:Uncharacterized sensor-like histidine kinase ycf26 n=1 Tax=Dicranema revolutum TaxID=239144 RepID=A0A4D6WQQ4_9FLOR|nr:Drug sensory protein A [Dicranema revolutum]